MSERHCVVLAGGLGTRLSSVTKGAIPKALVPILGRPFLDYKILSLMRMGVSHIWLLVGSQGQQIVEYVDELPVLGLNIRVIDDGAALLGTAGSIIHALDQLPNRFWITYADTYVTTNLADAEGYWDPVDMRTMCVLRNQDQYETSNISVLNGRISTYDKGATPGNHEWIDYGLFRLFKSDFWDFPTDKPTDLQAVLTRLIEANLVGAWQVNERFWEIGTPGTREETEFKFSSMEWGDLW
jgi:D-glycero-alpha-D-manno-heptose 1-phosphate guanylyltransferase